MNDFLEPATKVGYAVWLKNTGDWKTDPDYYQVDGWIHIQTFGTLERAEEVARSLAEQHKELRLTYLVVKQETKREFMNLFHSEGLNG